MYTPCEWKDGAKEFSSLLIAVVGLLIQTMANFLQHQTAGASFARFLSPPTDPRRTMVSTIYPLYFTNSSTTPAFACWCAGVREFGDRPSVKIDVWFFFRAYSIRDRSARWMARRRHCPSLSERVYTQAWKLRLLQRPALLTRGGKDREASHWTAKRRGISIFPHSPECLQWNELLTVALCANKIMF